MQYCSNYSGTRFLSTESWNYSISWWIPWNSGKSANSHEIHKNTKNTSKFSRNLIKINTCLYNIFETYFSYWGYLLAINFQIYLKTSSLKHANNIPKLPGVDYAAKNWALAMMLNALPLVTWDQALFSFRFENYIPAGKANRKQTNFSGAFMWMYENR